MIKVIRAQEPKILLKKAQSWLDSLMASRTENDYERALAKYRHKDVKDALNLMFHGKCAYCESKIQHVDYGDIEHFVPKAGPAGNMKLVFSWDNLLLACRICNGSEYKSDNFPGENEGGPILNPCSDEPSDHLEFDYNPKTRLASVIGKTDRGAITEELLGLNRRKLRQHRSKLVTMLYALLASNDDPLAAELLHEAVSSNAEYAAFARALTK